MVFSERQKLAEEIIFLSEKRGITANDLRANEGRETKALNCKPFTNLKEISELSNYSKTSGFRLHAVRGCTFPTLIYFEFACILCPSV
jgi:hypothetical protein